jgi:hypothetical protein
MVAGANCNNAAQCSRDNMNFSIATTKIGSTCYAAVAYDSWSPGSDGTYYAKSRLDIVDVTSKSNPHLVKAWISTSSTYSWNQYFSQVTANGSNLGWFWISDNQNACHAGVEGATDTGFGLTNMSSTGKFHGTFPVVVDSSGIFTDYVAATQHTVDNLPAGGYLYPSWNEAVVSTSTTSTGYCVQCQRDTDGSSQQYNVGAFIARILP